MDQFGAGYRRDAIPSRLTRVDGSTLQNSVDRSGATLFQKRASINGRQQQMLQAFDAPLNAAQQMNE